MYLHRELKIALTISLKKKFYYPFLEFESTGSSRVQTLSSTLISFMSALKAFYFRFRLIRLVFFFALKLLNQAMSMSCLHKLIVTKHR